MSFTHRAAGLTVAVTRRLPGLPAAPSSRSPEIHARIGTGPAWQSQCRGLVYAAAHVDEAGTPMLTVTKGPQGYCLVYADRTQFWIDRPGTTIWMTWQRPMTFEDACTYLVGPVLGFALRLRGELALHAAAVQVGRSAIAIAGPHGAGKSTTVAAFARRGFPVISDDLLRLTADGRGCVRAHPFGGVVRLWPDSEHLLYGATGGLPRITPTWDKRALAIGPGGVPAAADPMPLAAIVCLLARHTDVLPEIAVMRPADAIVQLAANTTVGYLLDARARAREFQGLARLVQNVPVASGRSGSGAEALHLFIDGVLSWHRAVASDECFE